MGSISALQPAISWKDILRAIPQLSVDAAEFARIRSWDKFDEPRNLVLALLSEVGELANLVQWKGDTWKPTYTRSSDQEFDKFAQELKDISIYLLRIASKFEAVSEMCRGVSHVLG